MNLNFTTTELRFRATAVTGRHWSCSIQPFAFTNPEYFINLAGKIVSGERRHASAILS
jgi:hypothetical protein